MPELPCLAVIEFFGFHKGFVSFLPCLRLVDQRPSIVELEKQRYCDLKVTNNTESSVAFKVKTTSPKKYFVRPNTGVIHPWDSCFIRVTLQAQKEYPSNMQCKDKFLLQSTIVNSDVDELPPDTFNKDSGRNVEECKLRVVYISPHSFPGHSEDAFKQNSDGNFIMGVRQG
ncbi:hypothetical protein KY284_033694 [Solanum tuberosum]|nr:hypothetical protein KY284_033694 [Solanum tuberosum]